MFSSLEFEYIDACPICGAPQDTWNDELAEGISQGQWIIYHSCSECEIGFQNPRLTAEASLAAYQGEIYRLTTVGAGEPTAVEAKLQGLRGNRILDIVKSLKLQPKRHLDVGASLGILCFKINKHLGAETWGVEASHTYRGAANKFEAVTVVENLDDLEGQFDLITCIHTLEHFNDPVAFLRSLNSYLAPGGCMLFETPDGRKTSGMSMWHPIIFIQETLAKAAEYAGYASENISVRPMTTALPDYAEKKDIPGLIMTINKPKT